MNQPLTGPYEPARDLKATPSSEGHEDSTSAEKITIEVGADVRSVAQRGNFTIVKEHARGGLGKVSVAIDARLKRNVALKEILPDRLASPQLRQRFITEAEITGLLEHPGVVPIYAFEEDAEGRPYYAMRFIQGRTLGEAIRAYHVQPEPLALRALLQRFVAVCQTVAFAHSKGVVHRDLKPANVMLGDYGETLVLDWGLAKRIEGPGDRHQEPQGNGSRTEAAATASDASPSTLDGGLPTSDLTEAGQILGTPAYMPPEQARGEALSPAADIYALGAMLYELLTGRPPYRGANAVEVLAQVRSGPPADPLTIQKKAPKPLAAICCRAMARAAADRYTAAGDVAREVDRWLADEPVSAYRDPLAIKAGRWVKRHKPLVTGAAALLLATVPLSLLLAANREQAREQSEAAKVEIGRQRDIAEANEKTAQENDAIQRAVIEFVEDRVFAAARPKDMEGGLGYDVKLKDAILAALPHIDRNLKDQPLVEARLRASLGKSFDYLGDAKIAGEQYLAARALYAKHRGPDDPSALAHTSNLACTYEAQGRYGEAVELQEKTLAQMKAVLGRDHRDTLGTMSNLVLGYVRVERYAEAVRLGEETLMLMKNARGPSHIGTLSCMHNLALSYGYVGRHADALKLQEEILMLEKARLSPDNAGLLLTMGSLASTYKAVGRYKDALKLTQEVLALRKAKFSPDHPLTLLTMHNLANLYATLGRHGDALKLREETLLLRKAKLGADHPDTVMSMWGVATSCSDLGRHAEALPLFKETLEYLRKKHGPDHPHVLLNMANVAMNLVQLDRAAAAVPFIDEYVPRAAGKPLPPELVPHLVDLRLRHFANIKDAASCRGTAEMWEKLNRTDADSLYAAARMRAVTAAVIKKDPRISNTEASRLATEEADRAMEWLRKAAAAGYKNVEHMLKDNDLDALRDRKDLKELLAAPMTKRK
jgi:serine/threonine protein kinase